jgi:hypothetical protein
MSPAAAPVLAKVIVWIGLGPLLAAGLWFDLSAAYAGIRTAIGPPTHTSTPPGLVLYLGAWFGVAAARFSSGLVFIPNWVFLALIGFHFLAFGWLYVVLLRRPAGWWKRMR